MTRYAHINSVPNGSTGRIMMKEHLALIDQGHESLACWGRRRPANSVSEYCFGSPTNFILDVGLTLLDGKVGFHSVRQTDALIHRLDEFGPDVVHLHNLHGYYLNIDKLFKWLMRSDCRVVWTLHDCWAFTGHYPYFTYSCCNQWKTGCGAKRCPQLMGYPPTINSASCKWSYEAKRSIFTSLPSNRMTIITPSKWLAGLVACSYLSKYPIEVVHNTIDLNVFKPRSNSEVFSVKEKYGLDSRKIILGVASPWSKRKGLSDFFALADKLDKSGYSIVLVGLSAKQMRQLPPGVVGIPRTDSQIELASLYSSASVLFNPTYEDNYPTVNLEAEACGVPVVCYDVGGCSETLHRDDSKLVECGDVLSASLLLAKY